MPGQVRLQNSIDGGAFLRNWDDQLMCWGGGGGDLPGIQRDGVSVRD